jgi:hypothetical protein
MNFLTLLTSLIFFLGLSNRTDDRIRLREVTSFVRRIRAAQKDDLERPKG